MNKSFFCILYPISRWLISRKIIISFALLYLCYIDERLYFISYFRSEINSIQAVNLSSSPPLFTSKIIKY